MSTETSAALLETIRLAHGKDIDLSLRSPYAQTLAAFGYPERKLPCPVIVAGTNGKGSTCAFLRAIAESTGHTAHVYTSPHLVRFHERIRIAGELIEEDELVSILREIMEKAPPGGLSVFEAGTAAALIAFSRHAADVTILEVGLGGRLDATNIVPRFAGGAIARLSFDHRDYLGDTMAAIAGEKAGILRAGTPCAVARQPSAEALAALEAKAKEIGTPLAIGGRDWRVEVEAEDAAHFRFIGAERTVTRLPLPALLGAHQIENAGLAIALALAAFPFPVPDDALRAAMRRVRWSGRLERLTKGHLVNRLPRGCELWLDGGHNDSAGEALAAQGAKWNADAENGNAMPLDLIVGMLASKRPEEFLRPLMPYVREVRTLSVKGEMPAHDAQVISECAKALGKNNTSACGTLGDAIASLSLSSTTPSRTLICGSLYLVGEALRENGGEIS